MLFVFFSFSPVDTLQSNFHPFQVPSTWIKKHNETEDVNWNRPYTLHRPSDTGLVIKMTPEMALTFRGQKNTVVPKPKLNPKKKKPVSDRTLDVDLEEDQEEAIPRLLWPSAFLSNGISFVDSGLILTDVLYHPRMLLLNLGTCMLTVSIPHRLFHAGRSLI